jgi:hypothetical protein
MTIEVVASKIAVVASVVTLLVPIATPGMIGAPMASTKNTISEHIIRSINFVTGIAPNAGSATWATLLEA